MSKAMRMGKRTLAGVAAGALGLALIPFIATSQASATTSTATASAVRGPATEGTRAAVPAAFVSWTTANANSFGTTKPTITLLGMTPGGAGTLFIDDSTGATNDDSVTLGIKPTAVMDDTKYAKNFGVDGTSSFIRVGVNRAGTYAGRIANGEDTVAFAFTTTGSVASVEVTPATQTQLIGGTAKVAVTLKDAAGNITQPLLIDSVGVTTNTAASPSPAAFIGSNTTNNLAMGTAAVTVTGLVAGANVVTAAGAGSLFGLNATATITGSGTVSDDTVRAMAVTAPTTGVWNNPALTFASAGAEAQVRAGTSSLSVTFDDTTIAPAGATKRLAVWVSNGTVNGQAATSSLPIYVDVATNANRQATVPITLGGAAILAGQFLTVQQATVANTLITNAKIVVTQVVPAATQATVSITPNGSNVRALGATTTVTVSVDDSLGDPVPGLAVLAYRTNLQPANLLSQGLTNAAGEAAVTVTSATGAIAPVTEDYKFVVATVGDLTAAGNALSIRYTASGAVTAMTVTPGSGTAVSNTGTPAVTAYPAISVPKSSTGGKIDGNASAAVYTISADAVTGTRGVYTTFLANTTPSNSVTVTAPEGVKLSTSLLATTIWSSGSQSVTIQGSNDDTVYAWSTKTGTHDITFESGGVTTTAKMVVVNASDDAYNIALTPAEQSVGIGSIDTATLTVTDVFGNPVRTTDDTGAVTIAASGQILLAGFLTSNTFTTNASGQATVTFIAGNAAGQGILTATPKTGSTLAQWSATTAFTPPAGAPAPVLSAVAEVGVGEAPVAAAIFIEGVRDNRRIDFEGVTTGLAEGTEVYPFIRFPGQSGFTQGTAVRTVSIIDENEQIGEFFWGRNTGKRTAVQFRDAAGLRSNTVIIAAR